MSVARRLIVRGLARGIRKARGGQVHVIRHIFDQRFADHSEQWRREVWQEAAERAAR